MTRAASIEGFWLGNWMARQKLIGKLQLIRTLIGLVLEGVLVSEVGESFPLGASLMRSRATAEQPGRGGKTLLKIGEP